MREKGYRLDTRQITLLLLMLPLMSGCCLKWKSEYAVAQIV